MLQYIIRRLLIAIPVLFGLTIATFTLTAIMPGDYVDSLIPPDMQAKMQVSEEEKERLREYYGLNKPIPVRYLTWLRELVLHGNLGNTMRSGRPVTEEFGSRLGRTLQLTVPALTLACLIGTTIGVLQALKARSLFDNIANLSVFLWISIPGFVFAIMAIYIFAFKLPIFPTGGAGPPQAEVPFWTRVHYMILPLAVLTIGRVPGYMRYARNSLLDILGSDFITVARSKGLKEAMVTTRHALRNALMSLITITGLSVPGLIGGAAIAETIFVWPGMGKWVLDSTVGRDYTVIVAMNLISSFMVLLMNIATDIAYAWADPRIRYE